MHKPASNKLFADVVHEALSFSSDDATHALVLDLIDCKWLQRLRDISQTANTRLVYMFSEHSRFGHSIGVAFLALRLMDKLLQFNPDKVLEYRMAVAAAALLHDVGHLAPGSHAAQRIWFPNQLDSHEELACRIVSHDAEINAILANHGSGLQEQVTAILNRDATIPPWTWEIVSGGGWNADRGNWCIVDSVLAGVSYGKYNIPALTDSIILTEDNHLALRENRLDAMMHFALSRQAMYRQIYQHRVILACDSLARALVRRARDLDRDLEFSDQYMKSALKAGNSSQLDPQTIFWMRESWWKYHLSRWSLSEDRILSDLAGRIIHRRLFKTVRIQSDDNEELLLEKAAEAVAAAGYDPRYYLHRVSTVDIHAEASERSMLVVMDDGTIKPFYDSEPLYDALLNESKSNIKAWLSMPAEVKSRLGRSR